GRDRLHRVDDPAGYASEPRAVEHVSIARRESAAFYGSVPAFCQYFFSPGRGRLYFHSDSGVGRVWFLGGFQTRSATRKARPGTRPQPRSKTRWVVGGGACHAASGRVSVCPTCCYHSAIFITVNGPKPRGARDWPQSLLFHSTGSRLCN